MFRSSPTAMAIAANTCSSLHSGGSLAARRRTPWCLFQWALLGAITIIPTGCAVHYGHARRGIETAWGVGRVTWAVERSTNGWIRVSSGTRLPGLVLGVGPDFLGVAVGYQVRERLQVVAAADPGQASASINGRELADTVARRWGVGRLSLRTPVTANVVSVNGRAGAGIGLGLENGRSAAALGWHSRQLTTVGAADVLVELTAPERSWPYFDFPATHVAFVAATNLTLRSFEP